MRVQIAVQMYMHWEIKRATETQLYNKFKKAYIETHA